MIIFETRVAEVLYSGSGQALNRSPISVNDVVMLRVALGDVDVKITKIDDNGVYSGTVAENADLGPDAPPELAIGSEVTFKEPNIFMCKR